MSYDLLFDAGSGKRIDRKSFAAYFKPRRHFTIGKGQAVYQNEDTGVYFIFDEPEDGFVAFNLNFYRPHTFGLEAAIELQAFSDAFGMKVTDPQGEGSEAETTFDRKSFIENWNHGNRFAYQSMLKEQPDEPVHTWPAKRIREVWEWNYARPAEDEWKDDDIFRPGIFAADVNGQPWSIAIWPPECSILIPEVDALLVPILKKGKPSEDLALVKWDELRPLLAPRQVKSPGLPRYQIDYTDAWPADVAAFLAKPRKDVGQMNGIALDEILDRELVEAARKK